MFVIIFGLWVFVYMAHVYLQAVYDLLVRIYVVVRYMDGCCEWQSVTINCRICKYYQSDISRICRWRVKCIHTSIYATTTTTTQYTQSGNYISYTDIHVSIFNTRIYNNIHLDLIKYIHIIIMRKVVESIHWARLEKLICYHKFKNAFTTAWKWTSTSPLTANGMSIIFHANTKLIFFTKCM